MEHELNAIEWALEKARYELRIAGEGYRDPELAERWGAARQEARRECYEKTCQELREVISGLESAAVSVSFGKQFGGAA